MAVNLSDPRESPSQLPSEIAVKGDSYVKENDYVIFRKNSVMKAFQVKGKRPVYFDKQSMLLDGIIGHPYGSVFDLKGKDLVRVENGRELLQASHVSNWKETTSVKDNRFLVDDGRSQQLTKDDIESLKEKGLSGTAIVEQLIANSSTFKDKTEFSQAKYMKKKHSKYANFVELLRPSTRLLVDMYYSQGASKILYLRMDSLAQLLTTCNIQASGRYMVLESCLGLVVGAVLERISSQGSLIHVYADDVPQQQTVDMYNFPEDTLNCLLSVKFNELVSSDVSKEKTEDGQNIENTNAIARNCRDLIKGASQNNDSVKVARKKLKQMEAARAKEILASHDMDGLIIASRIHPLEPLLFLMKFLSLSRPFAVFSAYQEPLVECYLRLKESGRAANLWLTEMWNRNYQVLPNRTHPNINMSGGSGYVLTGLTIAPN